MISLFLMGTASLGGALALLWSGCWRVHRTATLLACYHAAVMLTFLMVPDLWTPVRYVVLNSSLCILSAAVGLEAGLRARMERDAFAACAFVAVAAWAAVAVFRFLPGSEFRGMIAVYVAAASVLGIVAQRAHIEDKLAWACLWGLAATRWMQAVRLGLLEVGPEWSRWAGGCASVAWCVWLLLLMRLCLSADDATIRP